MPFLAPILGGKRIERSITFSLFDLKTQKWNVISIIKAILEKLDKKTEIFGQAVSKIDSSITLLLCDLDCYLFKRNLS